MNSSIPKKFGLLAVLVLVLFYFFQSNKEKFMGNPFFERIFVISGSDETTTFKPYNSDKISDTKIKEPLDDNISKILTNLIGKKLPHTIVDKTNSSEILDNFFTLLNNTSSISFVKNNIGQVKYTDTNTIIPLFLSISGTNVIKGIILDVSYNTDKYWIINNITMYPEDNSDLDFNKKPFNPITNEFGFYNIKNSRGLLTPFITSREDTKIEVPEDSLNFKKNNIFYF